MFGYYGDLPAYTRHLDALAEFVTKNPKDADGRFLLGYHDLMMGHRDEAKGHFAVAAAGRADDKVAGRLVGELSATKTATVKAPPTPGAPPQ